MDSSDCVGFENAGAFLEALDHWKEPCGAVVYLVASSRKVGRGSKVARTFSISAVPAGSGK